MPRYEYTEGTSNKFWEVELEGASLVLRWGRIGGSGHQIKTRTFADAAAARREHDKLIKEKTGKGYRLVGGSASKSSAATRTGQAGKSGQAAPASAAAPAPLPSGAVARPVPASAIKIRTVNQGGSRAAYLSAMIVRDRMVYASGGAWRRVAVLASSNGQDFHRRPVPQANGLRGARLRPDGSHWIVGEYGLIAVASQAAGSFRKIKAPTGVCLFDLEEDCRGVWWIAGDDGVVLRSTSKGKSWKLAETPLKGRQLALRRHGDLLYFLGAGVSSWDGERFGKPKGVVTKQLLTDLAVTPAGTIVVVGDGGVAFRSIDGGRKFEPVDTGTTAELEAVEWVAGALVAVGASGTILRSVDEGQSWKPLRSGTKAHLWGIGSWGSGALIGGDASLVLRLETPDDHYWDGATDVFDQPVVALDFTPGQVDREELQRRHQKLLEKALAAHQQLAARLASRRQVPDPDADGTILADPDDPAPYLVYGDLLQTRGDPRGELVPLQEPATGRARKPSAAERGLLTRHADQLLGKLKGFEDVLTLEWRWGFIRAARLASTYQRRESGDFDLDQLLGWLLDEPSARYLRELTVGIVSFEENGYAETARVIGQHYLPALSSLFLGDFHSEETELNWSNLGDLEPIWAAVPNLERLTLRSGSLSLGKLVLPRLRELTVITGGLDKAAMKSIARAQLPSLERLSLQLGSEYYGCDLEIDDLTAIFEGQHLPRLTHLGLANSTLADPICERLPPAPILPQLRTLDLSLGTLSDDGARVLAAHARAFAHLELLDLSRSYLSKKGQQLVEGICQQVLLEDQQEDEQDPRNRYIAAGE